MPTPPDLGITNPYWDEIAPRVEVDTGFGRETSLSVGNFSALLRNHRTEGMTPDQLDDFTNVVRMRHNSVNRWAWTITDPWTVQYVAQHCGGRVIDPMAGTGYWSYLLGQLGVNVVSTDRHPPSTMSDINQWHPKTTQFVPVKPMDGRWAAEEYGGNRTLLLSWPPYNTCDGYDVLSAYTGARVLYIGEGQGGANGDDSMFSELAANWEEIDWHQPVQWHGIHDHVSVFTRRAADKKEETSDKE